MVKSTGIYRKVDQLGRVVLPLDVRENFSIGEQSALELLVDEERGQIILQAVSKQCLKCGSDEVDLSGGDIDALHLYFDLGADGVALAGAHLQKADVIVADEVPIFDMGGLYKALHGVFQGDIQAMGRHGRDHAWEVFADMP